MAKVLVDDSGRGHVLLALTNPRQVQYVVVGPDGVLEREVICSDMAPDDLDAAFDRAGLLHVLIGGEHFVRSDGHWRRGVRSPWQEAGIKAYDQQFVSGAEDLTWTFVVRGKVVGVSGQSDWNIFGPYDPSNAQTLPYSPSSGEKLIVVPETAPSYTTWFALDLTDQLAVAGHRIAADAKGNIEVLYVAHGTERWHLGNDYRYARFRLDESAATAIPHAKLPHGPLSARYLLRPVFGAPMSMPPDPTNYFGAGSAAARGSQSWLFVKRYDVSRLVQDGQWSALILLSVADFRHAHLASAGGENFHALVTAAAANEWTGKDVPVIYLSFSDRSWSAPLRIGTANVASSFGFIDYALQIGSANNGKALAVWPTSDGIVGRWITIAEK